MFSARLSYNMPGQYKLYNVAYTYKIFLENMVLEAEEQLTTGSMRTLSVSSLGEAFIEFKLENPRLDEQTGIEESGWGRFFQLAIDELGSLLVKVADTGELVSVERSGVDKVRRQEVLEELFSQEKLQALAAGRREVLQKEINGFLDNNTTLLPLMNNSLVYGTFFQPVYNMQLEEGEEVEIKSSVHTSLLMPALSCKFRNFLKPVEKTAAGKTQLVEYIVLGDMDADAFDFEKVKGAFAETAYATELGMLQHYEFEYTADLFYDEKNSLLHKADVIIQETINEVLSAEKRITVRPVL